MTLSLFAVTQGYVVQASDRLVTLAPPIGPVPHDVNSNKSLVCEGEDFRALLSYAGLAYVDGLPADHFIAEALAAQSLEMDLLVQLGGSIAVGGLRDAAHRVSGALNEAQGAGRLPSELVVAIVGWRWHRNHRLRPFAWIVGHSAEQKRYLIFPNGLPRTWAYDRETRYLACPNPGGRYLEDVATVGFASIEELRDNLAGAIASVSRSVETVGSDVLATVLNASTGDVSYRFVGSGTGHQYSPWVITRRGVLHPSEVTGAPLVMRLGGLKIDLDCSVPDTGENRAQPRRPPPGATRPV